MSRLAGFWIRLRRALQRRALDQQLADEMREHVELEISRRVAQGEAPEAARRHATIAFGPVERYKERVRDRRLGHALEQVMQDVRYALRLLRKSPGFALVSITTLAVGIGANTAIFSAVDAVLLRAQPYPQADRLMDVFETPPSGQRNAVSGASFRDWFDRQTQFESLAIYANDQFDLTGDGPPEKINGLSVSAEFNRVLGVPPLLGRGFLPGDDTVGGANDVVVLAEHFWRNRFAASPEVLGRTLFLDGRRRTIVGVMPATTWFQRWVSVYVPYVFVPNSYLTDPDVHRARVLGRLAPAATVASARTELNTIKRSIESAYPAYKRTWGVGVQPLQQLLGQASTPVLLLLLSAVALVLLIACANVASLLLARAGARYREIALRAALGASGRRILRQVITESVVLSLLGGIAGVALAIASVELLHTLSARLLPATMEPRIDGRVLLFSVLASGGTGVLFGLFPAWTVRRLDLNSAIKHGTGGATDASRTRSQSALVVGEVALTAVLLVASGVLLRAMIATVTADPGIRPDRVLMFDLTMPYGGKYGSADQRMTFLEQALESIRALPGVESAATVDDLPYGGGGQGYTYSLDEAVDLKQSHSGLIKYVSPDYFETLAATMLRGRAITAEDNRDQAPRVLVVNDTLARTSFGDEEPIGRYLYVNRHRWEIVGVVADMRIDALHVPPPPMFFAPHWHFPWGSAFLVRTHGDPAAATASVAAAVHRIDPNLPLANVRTLESAIADSLGPQQIIVSLVNVFAAVALGLACIGLYGVMAYTVVCRRREIAIRAALGAVRSQIMRLVIRQGARLIATGVVLGLLAAFALDQVLTSRVSGVSGRDPLVYLGAALVLVAASLLASWLPAQRAARANVIDALRND